MARQTILQRQQAINRKKELLSKKEKVLKESLRKERTRSLIEKGALLEKTGLLSLDTNTLYGALLEIADQITNLQTLQHWTQKGSIAFAQEGRELNRSPVILQFSKQPSEEVRKTIRSLGLRWNALRQEWHGFAPMEPIQQIAQEHEASLIIPSTDERLEMSNLKR